MIVAVVGATASGKTGLGVALAQELDGEVVNADSMQLYRGMDIGTAKATEQERGGVPHHLLDIWPVTEDADVKRYQELARAAIADIEARGRTPVLVGGSGLYVRAVLDRFEFPGTDPELRRALEQRLVEEGPERLHDELAGRDPQAAAGIERLNGRRIVRALEVVELTGSFTATLPAEEGYLRPTAAVGLRPPRPDLHARIDARVDRMWERGLVEEVRHLAEHEGLRDGPTASRALGYAQVLEALDGRCTLEQARESTQRGTRRFARRQESWFGRDRRTSWLAEADVRAALAVVQAARASSGYLGATRP